MFLEREPTHGSVVRPATASTEQPFSRQQSLLSREASRIRMPLSGRQSPVLAPLLPPLPTTVAGLSTRSEPFPNALLNTASLPVPRGVQGKNIPLQSLDPSRAQSQSLMIVDHEVRSLTTVRPERTHSLSLSLSLSGEQSRYTQTTNGAGGHPSPLVPHTTRGHQHLSCKRLRAAQRCGGCICWGSK